MIFHNASTFLQLDTNLRIAFSNLAQKMWIFFLRIISYRDNKVEKQIC